MHYLKQHSNCTDATNASHFMHMKSCAYPNYKHQSLRSATQNDCHLQMPYDSSQRKAHDFHWVLSYRSLFLCKCSHTKLIKKKISRNAVWATKAVYTWEKTSRRMSNGVRAEGYGIKLPHRKTTWKIIHDITSISNGTFCVSVAGSVWWWRNIILFRLTCSYCQRFTSTDRDLFWIWFRWCGVCHHNY